MINRDINAEPIGVPSSCAKEYDVKYSPPWMVDDGGDEPVTDEPVTQSHAEIFKVLQKLSKIELSRLGFSKIELSEIEGSEIELTEKRHEPRSLDSSTDQTLIPRVTADQFILFYIIFFGMIFVLTMIVTLIHKFVPMKITNPYRDYKKLHEKS